MNPFKQAAEAKGWRHIDKDMYGQGETRASAEGWRELCEANEIDVPNKPEMVLWLSDSRGVYIPRDFANSFKDRAKHVTGVSDEEWRDLEAGPESEGFNEAYWDAWSDVLDYAVVTDEHGIKYTLYQNGDLWLIPVGMEYDEESDTYIWPKAESDN